MEKCVYRKALATILGIATLSLGCGKGKEMVGIHDHPPPAGCEDPDEDGYGDGGVACERTAVDCAPEDPSRHPGAAESCNGLDDNCDGAVDEVFDLEFSLDHCGGCDQRCERPNGDAACRGGVCTLAGCTSGYHDVDGDPTNGCEYPCSPSAPGIELCDGEDNDCDGAIDEDFDLQTDRQHCGACGTACEPVAGGEVGCVMGACAIVSCEPGRADCDLALSTGCEIDLLRTVSACGGCNTHCDYGPHTVATCEQGQCTSGGCEAGWADCDLKLANGCEVELDSGLACVCTPGETRACYTGPADTREVGTCQDGTKTCRPNGTGWGLCRWEVRPAREICDNGKDEDCNGLADDGIDADGDGWVRCGGDCCDIEADGCLEPQKVNPGAFEFSDNDLDDDCDGVKDNPPDLDCSLDPVLFGAGPPPVTTSAADLVQAMDLCRFVDAQTPSWGVLSAEIVRSDGDPGVSNLQVGVLDDFGPTVTPRVGATFAALSSGTARDVEDPDYRYPDGPGAFQDYTNWASPPPDYLAANDGVLQTHPGCPTGNSELVNDSVQLRLILRAPTNAEGFKFRFRFYSSEAPEWLCTAFNDFFLALLYSDHADVPADHNLSFDAYRNPISVNNAFFTTCEPRECGYLHHGMDFDADGCPDSLVCDQGFCTLAPGIPACPDGGEDLIGFTPSPYESGATAWLVTEAPVIPGEEIELQLHIWDTSDHVWDSTVLLDGFEWLINATEPSTEVDD